MGPNTREQAAELRAVAPLVVTGATPQLVGSCTLVTNGATTIGFASAEMLRAAGEPLAIAVKLDGSRTLPVASWVMGRHSGIGIVELAAPFPLGEQLDIAPLAISAVCASIDTRGAPAALVYIEGDPKKRMSRRIVPVYVDAVDGGGMSDDVISQLASPVEASDASTKIETAALFAWMPPDPVLGRGREIVAVALALPYRTGAFKPRPLAAIAELIGLEDLGRALPFEPQPKPEGSNELGQVAGELSDDDEDEDDDED